MFGHIKHICTEKGIKHPNKSKNTHVKVGFTENKDQEDIFAAIEEFALVTPAEKTAYDNIV